MIIIGKRTAVSDKTKEPWYGVYILEIGRFGLVSRMVFCQKELWDTIESVDPGEFMKTNEEYVREGSFDSSGSLERLD